MAAINCNQLADAVQLAANITTSSDTVDNLLLPVIADKHSTNKKFYVNSRNDLPDLLTTNLENGTVIFINDIHTHVVSNNCRWYGLDGRLYAIDEQLESALSWGLNNVGQLGNGNAVTELIPTSVKGQIYDWCQISAGCSHSIGLRPDGTAWAWGSGDQGRLGNNSTVLRSSPVSVVGGFTDWCRVSAGGLHSLGLRTNGTLWAWGFNGNGQLGDGATTSRLSPVSVIGGFCDWCQVSAGMRHSIGLRTNGTLWAWGCNAFGELGINCTTSFSSPVSVISGFTWCQVSAGTNFNLAIRNDGTLWAWGWGYCGVLGQGTTVTSRSSPVSVVGGFNDWCQISAGCAHSLGIRTNGTLWGWGSTGQGRVGDNNEAVCKSSPVSVVGGFTDWCCVSAGGEHSMGLRTNGTLWSWGRNGTGALGDGTTVNKSSPISVIGGYTWSHVSSGNCHSLGIRTYNI